MDEFRDGLDDVLAVVEHHEQIATGDESGDGLDARRLVHVCDLESAGVDDRVGDSGR